MPTRHEILDQLRAIAARSLDWQGDVSESSRLVEDLDLDSLRALTLLIEIENQLQIRLTPDDEAGLVTIGDLLTVIESRLAEGRESGS